MKGGARLYLAGAGVLLLALAGCGRGMLNHGERAPWRHQAEVACMKSGTVKIGAGVVQISPIEGPGMCGANFPLKVAALGESSAIGYADELRPPGAIPHESSAQMPRWPAREPYHARPVQVQPVQTQPVRGETLRWTPGPAGIDQRRHAPAVEQPRYAPSIEAPMTAAPAGRPMSIYAPGVALPDDIPDDAILPPGRSPTGHPRNTFNAPAYEPPRPQPRALPQLGPLRGPRTAAAIGPAAVHPPAPLAVPLL